MRLIALRLGNVLIASMVSLQPTEIVVISDMSSKMIVVSSLEIKEAREEAYLCNRSMGNIVRRSILKNKCARHVWMSMNLMNQEDAHDRKIKIIMHKIQII